MLREEIARLRRRARSIDLGVRPDVELALLALASRRRARRENAPSVGRHLALEPADRLARALRGTAGCRLRCQASASSSSSCALS